MGADGQDPCHTRADRRDLLTAGFPSGVECLVVPGYDAACRAGATRGYAPELRRMGHGRSSREGQIRKGGRGWHSL
jgi:hypothetical protein